jgi:hypothetical protein
MEALKLLPDLLAVFMQMAKVQERIVATQEELLGFQQDSLVQWESMVMIV